MVFKQNSLFRRLMFGFAGILAAVTLVALGYVVYEAKSTQRWRTAAENDAHAREQLLHLIILADRPQELAQAAAALENVRVRMFVRLDYHSRVRVRIWKDGNLVYNSAPELPPLLPAYGTPEAVKANSWVSATERDAASGLVLERSHEVDDEWMLSLSGLNVLMSSTIFSLPLLLLPAWLIVGIGLRPLRSIAAVIERRDEFDLTALPQSEYRELSPLIGAINDLLARLKSRLDRENEFITDAAHELKTPLASVQMNAHIILSRCDAPTLERCQEAGEALRDGVRRATHMVHQLLALERAHVESDGAVAVEMELSTFIRERVAALASIALPRDIEIAFETDSTHVRPVHMESMSALFDNLMSNAIKYSPDHGCIAVRLADCGDSQRLTITDQGPGIAPALRQKVFERFYRVAGQYESGSGLGLAIAERAARRNRAIIALNDTPEGKGLSVSVEFL
jgi:two-component system OmpR family sensor kinase